MVIPSDVHQKILLGSAGKKALIISWFKEEFWALLEKERLRMMNLSKRFIAEESGQDVAEYALLLVLVVIAIAVAAPTFTDAIMSVFSKTRSVLGI